MKMNQQEIFDKVATHLIAQGKQSLGSREDTHAKGCAYRGDDGTMCAAGCLIPGDEYKPDFEGIPWNSIAKDIPTFANAPQGVHDLITSLQGVHDDDFFWENPERLKGALRVVANRYDLSSNVLFRID